MKYLFLILLSIILQMQTTTVRADYSPTPLNYMILEADIAVYGEIERVTDNYFFLKIKKKVFGNYNDTIIKVKQFQNWTCAHRWTKYESGQNVFLFLVKDTNKDWSIMSGGGEGEFPIIKENIYIYATYSIGMPFVNLEEKEKSSGNVTTYKFGVNEVYGANFSGVEFNLNEFTLAVAGIRTCFQLTQGKTRTEDKIELLCTKENLDIYKSKSKLYNWLAEQCM